MSENLQDVFSDFVRNAKDHLARIDAKYSSDASPNAECLKNEEKIDIYKKLTERLIGEGASYLRVINHLNEELSKTDFDATTSTSSLPTADDAIFKDFESLRKCADKRANLEEEAMNSLLHLEHLVEVLLAEKEKLLQENNMLSAQNSSLGIGEDLTKSVIETLKKENEEFKEIIKHNEDVMKSLPVQPANIVPDTSVHGNTDGDLQSKLNDCLKNIKALHDELNEKDKFIMNLTKKLADLQKSKEDSPKVSDSSSSESKESSGSQSDKPVRFKKQHQRSRSDLSKTSSDSNTLTDQEQSDNDKLQMLKDAYKELTMILKEKYQQLREQRAKIAELLKRLAEKEDESAEKDDELIELQDLAANLKQENKNLIEKMSTLQENPEIVNELKQQTENLNIELEKMKDREILMARKLAMQDTNIVKFRDERQQLIKINNEMFESIATCKKELAKYNVNVD